MDVVMVGDFPRNVEEIEGGVEAVVTYLAEELQSLPDVNLMAVTLDRWGGKARVELQNGVPVTFVEQSRRPSRLWHWQNVERLKRAVQQLNPDIVHAHIANQYAAAARATGFRWVLTAHGIRHLEMSLRPGLINRYRAMSIRREEFELMQAAPALIAISPFIKDIFGAHLKGEVSLIDNPVDQAFFDVSREPVRGRILYVGRLIPRKDIMTLLRAFARVKEEYPHAQLRLAGEGVSVIEPAGYPAELISFIESNGLSENVTFLGQLDDASLRDEYRACEIMAVSSVLETAPMVILQAMAVGVPVVSTDVGGIRYLIDNQQSGAIVPPKDWEGMAKEMGKILGNRELSNKMSRRSEAIASKRFRAADVASKTRAIYQKLLAI